MITYYSIIIPLLAMIGVSFLIQRSSVKVIKDLSIQHRHATLDGLRGLAALFVVVHHSFFTFQHHINYKWHVYTGVKKELLKDDFLFNLVVNLGGAAVCLFFMLTGFLFFDKALNSNGKLNIKEFYKKRWFRIAPMYYFSIMLALILSISFGLRSVDGLLGAIKAWAGWFAYGLFPYDGFSQQFDFGRINAGVIWTLAIEWQFYFIFPLIFAFCEKKTTAIMFALLSTLLIYTLYVSGVYDEKKATIYLCFCFGMISALSVEVTKIFLKNKMVSFIASLVAIISLLSSLTLHSTVYHPVNIIYLFVFFFLVSSGCSLFGIANLKPLKLAGLISYSVYLMHGIILNFVASVLPVGTSHFYFVMISSVIVIPFCFVTYLLIERPFMSMKVKKLSNPDKNVIA